MAQISVMERKCTGCGACLAACPFQAIEMDGVKPQINEACRVCGLCLKACPEGALLRLETRREAVDKSAWKGILVFVEQHAGKLHPVSLELIGEAHRLAVQTGETVHGVLLGDGVRGCAEALSYYGLATIAVYEHAALSFFRADVFAACVAEEIARLQPSVVLVGATALGRSLAPRLATRFRTGLTADCTRLALRDTGDLVQIRPAFGGNIMAQIVTPFTRPQFATVRYKVMEKAERRAVPGGEVLWWPMPREAESPVRHVRTEQIPKVTNISDAQVLVVGGRGLQKQEDLGMVKRLAHMLQGEYAVTRPLVERGWAEAHRQIGLSGRTVKPKLILTCGVSGAIQFTASMEGSEHIIAINQDPKAPIFRVAHVGIVGDIYQVLPGLMERMERGAAHENL